MINFSVHVTLLRLPFFIRPFLVERKVKDEITKNFKTEVA